MRDNIAKEMSCGCNEMRRDCDEVCRICDALRYWVSPGAEEVTA
jgi:hypothetical protein